MTEEQRLQDAKALLAEATGRGESEIPPGAAVESWEPWDSLAHVRVVLAIEARLGHELDPARVASLATLEDIAACLDGVER
ncbi:MAG TPA: acyl carrier protein [Sphingomonadales bacterium]|nr:acyl carrier protein [Sphingomonadales bacterium]